MPSQSSVGRQTKQSLTTTSANEAKHYELNLVKLRKLKLYQASFFIMTPEINYKKKKYIWKTPQMWKLNNK